MHRNKPGWVESHADMIATTRELLRDLGKPYVIENVPGAPLECPITLCGTMFGLKVYRHRLFESNLLLLQPPHVPHRDKMPKGGTRGAGAISPKGFITVCGHFSNVDYARKAMDIDWMVRDELSQAIPPAYTKFVGQILINACEGVAVRHGAA
jgi:DNA (cytosine-5)-methyltransferase 1